METHDADDALDLLQRQRRERGGFEEVACPECGMPTTRDDLEGAQHCRRCRLVRLRERWLGPGRATLERPRSRQSRAQQTQVASREDDDD